MLSTRILELEREEFRIFSELLIQENLLQSSSKETRSNAAMKIPSLKTKVDELRAALSVSMTLLPKPDNEQQPRIST